MHIEACRKRSSGKDTYQVPSALPFRLVACPHYLGEIVSYMGVVLMCLHDGQAQPWGYKRDLLSVSQWRCVPLLDLTGRFTFLSGRGACTHLCKGHLHRNTPQTEASPAPHCQVHHVRRCSLLLSPICSYLGMPLSTGTRSTRLTKSLPTGKPSFLSSFSPPYARFYPFASRDSTKSLDSRFSLPLLATR